LKAEIDGHAYEYIMSELETETLCCY